MKQRQEIFEQAMALPSGAAREEFLPGACGRNRELRGGVDQLPAAFHDTGELDFLKSGERSQETPTVGADPQRHELVVRVPQPLMTRSANWRVKRRRRPRAYQT